MLEAHEPRQGNSIFLQFFVPCFTLMVLLPSHLYIQLNSSLKYLLSAGWLRVYAFLTISLWLYHAVIKMTFNEVFYDLCGLDPWKAYGPEVWLIRLLSSDCHRLTDNNTHDLKRLKKIKDAAVHLWTSHLGRKLLYLCNNYRTSGNAESTTPPLPPKGLCSSVSCLGWLQWSG